jgi:uncharacterized iron-regulated protein
LKKSAPFISKPFISALFALAALAYMPTWLHAQVTSSGLSQTSTVWLMGEVHDNPDAHAYRLRDLRVAIDAGWRPAILMEQFDLDRQAELTKAWQTCKQAQCVINRVGQKGWQWPLYEPLIQLALDRRLPLIAANLSRDQLREVMKNGYKAVFDSTTIKSYGLDKPLAQPWLDTQREAIRVGHCNMLPEQMIDPMVSGQAARDIQFAELIAQYAKQGVVLIAGNGHVRRDLGVTQWLADDLQANVTVFAYVEPEGLNASVYDRVRVVPELPRPDPCEVFRKRPNQ